MCDRFFFVGTDHLAKGRHTILDNIVCDNFPGCTEYFQRNCSHWFLCTKFIYENCFPVFTLILKSHSTWDRWFLYTYCRVGYQSSLCGCWMIELWLSIFPRLWTSVDVLQSVDFIALCVYFYCIFLFHLMFSMLTSIYDVYLKKKQKNKQTFI